MTGCAWRPSSEAYNELYAHLDYSHEKHYCSHDDFYIIFLVDARHLDYTNNRSLCKTLAKHPSDGSKNGDVGHAWVYLHGNNETIEGGHSGECREPKYLNGVMDRIEEGNPNPVAYLWTIRDDGFFQNGSGKHIPTFAAKVSLNEEEFLLIRDFIFNYNYREYALTGNQCSSFVAQIGKLIDFPIECQITMEIDKWLEIGGNRLALWGDPRYSYLTFSSPDVVERSLIESVNQGKAENVLDWYKTAHPKRASFNDTCNAIKNFPSRLCRLLVL